MAIDNTSMMGQGASNLDALKAFYEAAVAALFGPGTAQGSTPFVFGFGPPPGG